MAPFFTGLARRAGGFGGRKAKSLVTTIYTYTGSWTRYGYLSPTITTNTLSIPGDTTSVKIRCEGAGFSGFTPGGLAEGTFTNLAGKTLTATIRGGGEGGLTRFFDPNPSPGNNGLHFAGVFDGPSVSQPTALVIAGGAACNGSAGPSQGGLGGGPSGSDGTAGSRNEYTGPGDSVGRGSPGSSGGAGGSAWWPGGNPGSPGSALQGGTGGEDTSPLGIAAGGGGGGGYWGGGGAGSGRFDGPNQAGGSGGGGGGSGYVHPSATLTTNSQGASTVGTSGQITITVTELV